MFLLYSLFFCYTINVTKENVMSEPFLKNTKVAAVFPVGRLGVIPVPNHLDIKNFLETRDSVYLYNPFASGLTTKSVPISSLSYRELSQAVIVDAPNVREMNSRGSDNLNKFSTLNKISKVFWPVFVSVSRRVYSSPKREADRRMEITPDMGLVIQKPKRKIEGPRLVHRPGPPKPGGR